MMELPLGITKVKEAVIMSTAIVQVYVTPSAEPTMTSKHFQTGYLISVSFRYSCLLCFWSSCCQYKLQLIFLKQVWHLPGIKHIIYVFKELFNDNLWVSKNFVEKHKAAIFKMFTESHIKM